MCAQYIVPQPTLGHTQNLIHELLLSVRKAAADQNR